MKLLGDETSSPLTLEDIFVNLVIVKEDQQKREEYRKLSNTPIHSVKNEERSLGLLNSPEDIRNSKEAIHLKDLFKPENASEISEIKRLLLLGRAGIGKSTLCRYLAYRWANSLNGEAVLAEFSWVFHIDLKRLANEFPKENSANKTLSQLLHHYYWKQYNISEADAHPLWEAIQRQGNPILFILDSYDEVSHLYHPLVEELLKQPYYLLTSRSHKVQLRQHKVDKVLENIGFLASDIQKYIDNYFSRTGTDIKIKKELEIWLKQQPAVSSMCIIPIYLELLCLVWATDREKLRALDHIQVVDLYNLLIERLFKKMLGKIDPANLDGHQEMDSSALNQLPDTVLAKSYLSHLAFEGLKTGRLLMSGQVCVTVRDELRNNLTSDGRPNIIAPVGYNWGLYKDELLRKAREVTLVEHILKGVFFKNSGDSEDVSKNHYYFLHLTFQEYFAALYISQDLESHRVFIAEYKYNQSWQLVWVFLTGLIKDDEVRLNRFFELLLEEPRDVWGRYEADLLLLCLEACGWSNKLKHDFQQLFIQYLQMWIIISVEMELWGSIISTVLSCPYTMEKLEVENLLLQYYQENREDKDVLDAVIKILSKLQNPSEKAVSILIAACEDKSAATREIVRPAINKLKLENPSKIQKYETLLSKYNDTQQPSFELDDAEQRSHEVIIIDSDELKNPTKETIITLLQAYRDSDRVVRIAAQNTLNNFQHFNEEVIEGLLDECNNEERSVRKIVVTTLGRIKDPSQTVLNFFIEACEDKEPMVYEAALKVLANLQTPDKLVISTVLKKFKSENQAIFKEALNAFGTLHKSHPELVIAVLQENKHEVFEGILLANREFNENTSAQEIIQSVQRNDLNPNHIGYVLHDALNRISVKECIKILREFILQELDPYKYNQVKVACFWTAWICMAMDLLNSEKNRLPIKDIIAIISELCDGNDSYRRELAIHILRSIPPTEEIINLLIRVIDQDKDKDSFRDARSVLYGFSLTALCQFYPKTVVGKGLLIFSNIVAMKLHNTGSVVIQDQDATNKCHLFINGESITIDCNNFTQLKMNLIQKRWIPTLYLDGSRNILTEAINRMLVNGSQLLMDLTLRDYAWYGELISSTVIQALMRLEGSTSAFNISSTKKEITKRKDELFKIKLGSKIKKHLSLEGVNLSDYILVDFFGDGCGFFYASALALQSIGKIHSNGANYNVKTLRQLCYNYTMTLRAKTKIDDESDHELMMRANKYIYYLSTRRVATDAIEQTYNALTRSELLEINSRILCKTLGIKIHWIEVLDDEESNISISHKLQNNDGTPPIPLKNPFEIDHKDEALIHLAIYKNNIFPLLKLTMMTSTNKPLLSQHQLARSPSEQSLNQLSLSHEIKGRKRSMTF